MSNVVQDEIRLAVAELRTKGERVGTGAEWLGLAGVLALIGRKHNDCGIPPVPHQVIANIKHDIATASERAHR